MKYVIISLLIISFSAFSQISSNSGQSILDTKLSSGDLKYSGGEIKGFYFKDKESIKNDSSTSTKSNSDIPTIKSLVNNGIIERKGDELIINKLKFDKIRDLMDPRVANRVSLTFQNEKYNLKSIAGLTSKQFDALKGLIPDSACDAIDIELENIGKSTKSSWFNENRNSWKNVKGLKKSIKTREISYTYKNENGELCDARIHDETGLSTIGLTLHKIKSKNNGTSFKMSQKDYDLLDSSVKQLETSSRFSLKKVSMYFPDKDKPKAQKRLKDAMSLRSQIKEIKKNDMTKEQFKNLLVSMDNLSEDNYVLVESLSEQKGCVKSLESKGNSGKSKNKDGLDRTFAKVRLNSIFSNNLSQSDPWDTNLDNKCSSKVSIKLKSGQSESEKSNASEVSKD